ncbi:MAG: type III pantothenate kinase [Spartobacteria bacterium]|nr:type III pantothenate kinase [Spartobacteria bacterium]
MTTQRILVVDIGNTSTSLGMYTRGRVCHMRFLKTSELTAASLAAALDGTLRGSGVSGAIMACVAAPKIKKTWTKGIQARAGVVPLDVSARMDIGIPVTYPEPETIGADRLANAVGASARYGTPVIVADFGTALTFDVVDAVQGYIGGVIAPGLPLMFDYLHERTAKLPYVHPGTVQRAIGKSTEEAIRIGTQIGYQGMVKEILRHIRNELGRENVPLCATGGYAKWILEGSGEDCVVAPDLTLYGLVRIYHRVAGNKSG